MTLYEDKSQQERIEEYIMYQLKQAGCQGVSLGTLGNKIRNKFGNFKVRDYGYFAVSAVYQKLSGCRFKG